jgi:hypothetical protein
MDDKRIEEIIDHATKILAMVLKETLTVQENMPEEKNEIEKDTPNRGN